MNRKLVPIGDTNHVEVIREESSIELSYYRVTKTGEIESITRMAFDLNEWDEVTAALNELIEEAQPS